MKRLLAVTAALAATVVLLFGFTATANAQTYPPAVIVVDGGTVTGDGFPPGSTVTITLDGEVIGTAVVGPDGTFSFNYTPPTACGTHTLVATDGTTVATTTIIVRCTPTPGGRTPAVTPAGTLPYTGSDSSIPLAQIGAGLLALGGIAVLVVRKRATAA